MVPDKLHKKGRRRFRSVKAKPTHAVDVSVIKFLVSTLSVVADNCWQFLPCFRRILIGMEVTVAMSLTLVSSSSVVSRRLLLLVTLLQFCKNKPNESRHLSCARSVSSCSSCHWEREEASSVSLPPLHSELSGIIKSVSICYL